MRSILIDCSRFWSWSILIVIDFDYSNILSLDSGSGQFWVTTLVLIFWAKIIDFPRKFKSKSIYFHCYHTNFLIVCSLNWTIVFKINASWLIHSKELLSHTHTHRNVNEVCMLCLTSHAKRFLLRFDLSLISFSQLTLSPF